MKSFFTNIASIIQVILTPAIMISACGLIFLGLQNRYGRIVDRLRKFIEDKRNIIKNASIDKELLSIIEIEINDLLKRGLFIKNSVRLLLWGILFFVLTSLSLAAYVMLNKNIFSLFSFVFFISGYLSIFISAVYAILEINLSYLTLLKECKE